MPAPTVRQIRDGMAERLDTIDGLRVFAYIPGQFSPPSAIVGMPFRRAQETMSRGTDRWELTVWVVVSRQADAQSEKALEGYLNPDGAGSVRAAVLADTTLGGVIGKGAIHELEAVPTDFVFGTGNNEVRYIGLEFTYTILAAGKD